MPSPKQLSLVVAVALLALTPFQPIGAQSATPAPPDPPAPHFWAKSYGGTGDDQAYAVAATSDGGYVVAGTTQSFGTLTYDAWVLKLDGSGHVNWQKTYGGGGYDFALAAAPTGEP